MIIKKDTLHPFERYVMMEAPARKPYIKVVTSSPDNRLKKFEDNIEVDPEEEDTNTPDTMDLVDDTDFEGNIEDDMADIPDEEVEQEDDTDPDGLMVDPPEGNAFTVDPESDEPVPTEPVVTGDTGAETPQETPDNPDAQDNNPPDTPTPEGDEGGGGNLETDAPGGDFADNIEDTGDESMEDDTPEEGGEEVEGTPNTEENQLKYSLYLNMKHLLESVRSYIEKIDSVSSPSINYNMVLKTASDKLNAVEEGLYEYMTVKFRDEGYLASMQFYQKCLVTVQCIFQLIRENKQNDILKDGTLN